jgi:hypothetical protein
VQDYINQYKVDPRDNGEVIELHFHLNELRECVMFNVQKGGMFNGRATDQDLNDTTHIRN